MRSYMPASVAAVITIAVCFVAVAVRGGEDDGRCPVALRGTEVRSIASSLVEQEFKLHIYIPSGYADSKRVFPAVYLTDSDAYFGFFRSMMGNLQFGNLVPEVVVVGIAYEEDTRSYLMKRERDMLPAAVEGHPHSGHAGAFLRFMAEELFPFVESRYRVDPRDRTIVGMSAGATFAAYVLFTAPELFQRYIIVSPYFVYGQEVVLELEEAYAADHSSLPARLYTAMGALEPDYARGPWNTLVERIRERDYTDLRLKQELLDGLSHMDVVFTACVNGLKEIFSEPSELLRAVPENYAACAGRYELALNGICFTVRFDDGRLFVSRSGEYWDELIPVSDTRFAVEANNDVRFSFVTDDTGAVRRMLMYQLGMEIPAERSD